MRNGNKIEQFETNDKTKIMIACENSRHDITYDFPEVRKIVKAGATEKPVIDYELNSKWGTICTTVADEEKRKQEINSLKKVADSFKK